MVGRRAVAVAGTHGKTTTTSLLTVALQHCGADPSFAIGGNLNESGRQRAQRLRRRVRRRGRRERRLVPALLADRRGRHQRRGRPPRPLRHRRGGRRRRSRRSRGGSSPAASWSPAPTTRAPRALAASARARGVDVRTYGEGAGRRPAAGRRCRPGAWAARSRRCCSGRRLGHGRAAAARAGTTRSTPPPRCVAGVGLGLPGRAAARGAGELHRHPAAVRAQGHRGRRPGLRQLRPPPDRAGRRPARGPRGRPAAAGSSWCSSRTCSAAPGSSPPSSARRSGWPTRSS